MRGDDQALMSVGWLRFRIRHILTLLAGPILEILSCPSFSFKSLGYMALTKRNLKKIQTGQKKELGLNVQTSLRLCKLSLRAKIHVIISIVSVVFGEFYLQLSIKLRVALWPHPTSLGNWLVINKLLIFFM